MNRLLYALHRWLSLAVLLQFAAWLVSGLFFAVVSKEAVHGAHVAAHSLLTPDDGTGLLSPGTALAIAAGTGFDVDSLELRRRTEGPVYLLRGPERASLRLDARTGAVLSLTREEAVATATHDQPGSPGVVETALVERDAPLEYRDRPLPAWRVALADGAGTIVWVDARSGEVTARRNDRWRQYDFLWSLHIMDYRGRESFRHPLLIAAAALGLLTVVSGVVLWTARVARWRRRRARRA